MKLYDELADWYPLLTPREDYREEAAVYDQALRRVLGPGRHALLELGAGAGHNAYHLAEGWSLCLTDLSPRMLDLARANCPGAQIVQGDMRRLRLGRTFDAVFLHDAVSYMATEEDLSAAFATARAHLRPGGAFLVAPDYVAETFSPGEDCGGSDGEGRALRYLEWCWQRPGQTDGYVVDYTVVTRIGEGLPEVHHDRHEEGLFPRAAWLRLLDAAGFDTEIIHWNHSEVEVGLEMFLMTARLQAP